MPATNTVQQAYDLIDAYGRATSLLSQAYAEIVRVTEHDAENEASGCPCDLVQDTQAALTERVGLLRQWLAVHDAEEAYP